MVKRVYQPMPLTLDSDAARAYAVLAPAYDLLTAGYAYGPWLAAIERLALRHGLSGRRVLDVGCGTGKSFLPLLDRGFDVTACDISPEKVAEDEARLVRWRGAPAELDGPRGEAEVVIDVFTHEGDGLWRRSVSRQRHRHHPIEELRELTAQVGLEVAAVVGQRPGAVLDDTLDERVHRK